MADVKGNLPQRDDGLDVVPKKKHPRYNVQSPESPDEHDRHRLNDGSGVILESLPRSPPSGLQLFVLCVLSVLLNVVMNVSLPVFSGTMKKVGGDSFALLMYGALIYPLVLAALTVLLKVRSHLAASAGSIDCLVEGTLSPLLFPFFCSN